MKHLVSILNWLAFWQVPAAVAAEDQSVNGFFRFVVLPLAVLCGGFSLMLAWAYSQ